MIFYRRIIIFKRLSLTMMAVFLLLLGCVTHQARSTVKNLARVNGAEIYYEVCGDGSPLLLLHGFAGTTEEWREFVPELAKFYKVISVDLRGHGLSTNPGNRFTHQQAALDVLALMDHLNLDRVRAMGISSGGMTLLRLAIQYPNRIEAMALIGATTRFTEQARNIMRGTTFESLTPEELKELRLIHPHGDEQIRVLLEQFHNFQYSYDDVNFTATELSTITARTLIVHGDRDEFFPVDIALDMYRAIPNSYLWIVPDCGHTIINASHPLSRAQREAFLKTALTFLLGVQPG